MRKAIYLLVPVLLFPLLGIAQIEIGKRDLSYRLPLNECTELTFPSKQWGLPLELNAVNGRIDFLGTFSDFEFRTLNNDRREIAVTVEGLYLASGTKLASPFKYAFSIVIPSKLRSITDAEWQSGTPLKVHREGCFARLHNARHQATSGQRCSVQGKAFYGNLGGG
jgi:hypothetical protein